MSGFLSILASGFASLHLMGVSALPGPIPVELVSVIDGDTIAVRAHIWPGQYVETRVRLAGVDTPETRRPACEAERSTGHEATDFTQAWVTTAQSLTISEVQLGSFAGRVVAKLHRDTGEELGEALLSAGLASVYGTDDPWCEAQPESN